MNRSSDSAQLNAWLHPRGALARDPWETVVDARLEGWRHTGLRVAEVTGSPLTLPAGDVERIVVPLAASFTVEYQTEGERLPHEQALAGRASVFDGPTDVLYLPIGTSLAISGTGRVAVAEAPATAWHPPRHVRAEEVPVELRG
ncbi:MAG: 5-deoxy-glucuronate isomerase, partial [Acidimicrobiia bacterium]